MFGSIGTPWWNRLLKGRLEDDHLKLVRCRLMGKADAFLGELRSELGSLSAGQRHLLVYLHGYNVSFEDAALRAAQIGFDLKVQGATAFFSWPSCASAPSYGADLARIEASEQDIADFLAGLASDSAADVIHVVAHSMGNRGLARAVQRITAAAADTSRIHFGQIILAAPDLDVALFKDLARIYPAISARTTMYCCPRDRVLQLSRWMQDSNRAGFTPPVTVVDGIDTVEVTNIDLTLLGHGYHAEAESILRDMKELIDHNAPPLRRARLRESRTAQGQSYWSIT